MNVLKKNEYFIMLFVINAAAMILELIAARILSPFFGSGNITWTIIISIILFSNAVGNYLGGMLSAKYDLYKLKTMILLLTSVCLLILSVYNRMILQTEKGTKDLAIMFIVIFLIPNILIGSLSPIANKAVLSEAENIGKKSGTIYVMITAGSLIGTMFGGLLLVPMLGSGSILFSITILMEILLVFSMGINNETIKPLFKRFMYASSFVVFIITYMIFIFLPKTIKSDIKIIDTTDGYVRILDTEYHGEKVKMFEISGGFSSAQYLDESRKNENVYPYLDAYNVVFDNKSDIKTTCMIGGAGYMYPRYVISHKPDVNMDVVEIDSKITDAALNYFGLKEFLDEYGSDRMKLYNDDGRLFLKDKKNAYDVIFNDAFSGQTPARSLCTIEAVNIIKKSLKDNGIYAANLHGEYVKYRSSFLQSELKTIASVFKYVWMINVPGTYNKIVIASDYDYGFDSEEIIFSDSLQIYTDDYDPVDYEEF